MKKKSIHKHRLRKFGHITLLASALLVGVVFAQNGSKPETKKSPPKIESISPSTIIVGKEFKVTGSGFTTEEEFKGPRRAGGIIPYYPGNWYQIKGSVEGPVYLPDGSPAYSPDGKTLEFKLSLNHSRDIPKDCLPGTTGKACRVPFQVVNGYGVASNVQFVEIFISDKPQIIYTGYAPDSPTNINVTPGTQNFEILKIKARADAQNIFDIKLTYMMLQTGPASLAIDCVKTFGYITAFEVESGQQIGIDAMVPNWFNPGCMSMFQLNPQVIIPPGTEKTILVKMSLNSTAPVGLQFNVGGGPTADGALEYPGQGSYPTITIVAP